MHQLHQAAVRMCHPSCMDGWQFFSCSVALAPHACQATNPCIPLLLCRVDWTTHALPEMNWELDEGDGTITTTMRNATLWAQGNRLIMGAKVCGHNPFAGVLNSAWKNQHDT